MFNKVSFLRRVLAVDAISSGSMGILLLVFAAGLGELLSLPEALLREAGLILLPFALVVGFVASRPSTPRWAVRIIIAANVVWTIDSAFLLFSDGVQPNVLGNVLIVAQAIVVAVLAELELTGLRRDTPVTA